MTLSLTYLVTTTSHMTMLGKSLNGFRISYALLRLGAVYRATRTLYTTADETLFKFRRCFAFSSIGASLLGLLKQIIQAQVRMVRIVRIMCIKVSGTIRTWIVGLLP